MNALYPPSRPQSVGEILDSALRIFRATVVKCIPYAALSMIANQLPNIRHLLSGHVTLNPFEQLRDPNWWLLDVIGSVLGALLLSAILLRQYAVASNPEAPQTGEFAAVLRRTPGIILQWILLGLAVGVWFLPLVLPMALPARIGLGVLLLIPASCVLIALSCGWPLLLITGRGALESLVHSARLTRGSWMRLSVIWTVAVIIIWVLEVVMGSLIGAVTALLVHGDLVVITAVSTVVMLVVNSVITPFYPALALAITGDLIVRKEGSDLALRIAAPNTQ